MNRPKLLDLYCRAGGSSMGYYLAGFDVDGVDCDPQKHFPKRDSMRFFQSDAIEFLRQHGHEYDAIAASPPCEGGSALSSLHRHKGPEYDARHPNLIPATREALLALGKPYVIENVVGYRWALINPVILCGTMFGLQTDCGAVLRRHRLFETNWLLTVGLECRHKGRTVSITGHGAHDWAANYDRRRTISVTGSTPQTEC
jgi:DNA (cytosine-5)-methyltransferase 1